MKLFLFIKKLLEFIRIYALLIYNLNLVKLLIKYIKRVFRTCWKYYKKFRRFKNEDLRFCLLVKNVILYTFFLMYINFRRIFFDYFLYFSKCLVNKFFEIQFIVKFILFLNKIKNNLFIKLQESLFFLKKVIFFLINLKMVVIFFYFKTRLIFSLKLTHVSLGFGEDEKSLTSILSNTLKILQEVRFLIKFKIGLIITGIFFCCIYYYLLNILFFYNFFIVKNFIDVFWMSCSLFLHLIFSFNNLLKDYFFKNIEINDNKFLYLFVLFLLIVSLYILLIYFLNEIQ